MRSIVITLVLALIPVDTASQGSPAAKGRVDGRLAIDIPGASLAKLGPIVVFATAIEGDLEFDVPEEIPDIRQSNAMFSPSHLVITAGQTVRMPNDDTIYHNVFSYSKAKRFDLGLYKQGESRSVTFPESGVVRIYCSIHKSMNGIIFVAPSPYHATAGKTGRFSIPALPAGRYYLRTWCDKLPATSQEIVVEEGESTSVQIHIGRREPDAAR